MAIYVDNSWIKLPRKFIKWQWYHNSNMVHLYLHLLLTANIKDIAYEGKIIHRGEIITTLPKLASSTSLTIDVLRLCLKKLEKTKEIKSKSFNRGRIIILLDFNTYQTIDDEDANNWVQLFRNIINWQWYSMPKFVHFIIHIRLHSYPVVMNNGQVGWECHTSLKKLYEETGISIKCLRTCIEKLVKAGEITYIGAHQESIVTICNYGTYEGENKTSPRQIPDRTQTEPRQVSFAPKRAHVNNLATVNSTRTYEDDSNIIAQTNPRQIPDKSQTNPRQIPALKNKNIKKERIKENIFDDYGRNVHVCVREDIEQSEQNGKEKNDEKQGKFAFLLSDEAWCNAICKKFALRDKKDLSDHLDAFSLELLCRGKEEHKDLKDLKCHFFDWMKSGRNMPISSKEQATDAKAIGERYAEAINSSQEQRESASDEALRKRILGMISLLDENPHSLCKAALLANYNDGTMARLGIDWQPRNQ